MTPGSDRQHKPRSWDELRKLVLEQDYLEVDELEQRRRRAHQMKYAVWLVPIVLVGVAPTMIIEGWSWLVAGAVVLIVYGAVSSWRLGARWERRWDELIREKTSRAG
jgi:hypothetical protein